MKVKNTSLIMSTAVAAAVALVVAYVIFYQVAPLAGIWNDIALNLVTTISALCAAIVSTAIYYQYHPGDFPRAIWRNFMFGTWAWTLGELIWGVFDVVTGNVPVPSPADVAWVLGFVFFSMGLYRQYIVINPKRLDFARKVVPTVWIGSFVIPLILLVALRSLTVDAYVDYWYSVADFSVGFSGLLFFMTFQGGRMSHAWVGLILFGLSDFLYAWAVQTGLYAWSVDQGNLLSLVIDSSYIAAYLILALGFLSHWVLLRYGANDPRN